MREMKHRFFAAAAIAALLAGAGVAGAQDRGMGAGGGLSSGGSAQGSGQELKGNASGRGSAQGSATTGSGGSSLRGSASESSNANERSNAREPQGPIRSSETPGEKGSNARGAQGPKQSQSSQQLKQSKSSQQLKQPSTTTGQGPSQQSKSSSQVQSNQRSGTVQNQDQLQQRSTTTGQGTSSTANASAGVNLTTQQRTQIHNAVFQSSSVPHLSRSNVNFDLRVGVLVPRTIEFVDVPEDVVVIFPRFRRHKVFIVDNEIVIVDPVTFRIVAVIPA